MTGDTGFTGSIPDVYERVLVPLIFDPYAIELAGRLGDVRSGDLLELAAGTGAVTRRLAAALPSAVRIVATDLNQPMLDRAAEVGTARPVEWRQADAQALPFDDDSFDVVVCQFGVMFFPDRPGAFAEVRRVLRPGGRFVFDVWTQLADSELAAVVVDTIAGLFPDDPPTFVERIPHGYHDPERIAADLRAGGFIAAPTIDAVEARSRAASAHDVAVGYCRGTPMFNEIVARDPSVVPVAIERATAALTERFGATDLDAAIRALVVTATG